MKVDLERKCIHCRYRVGTYCVLKRKEVMPDMSCPDFAPVCKVRK